MDLSQYLSLVNVQARMSLKADASRYFLSYIWWVLEPLLYVAVFYVVFDVILKSDRADFLVFLMCGKLPFVWFSKSVVAASNSIIANAGLIGRIDIPKSLFPMASMLESSYKQIAVFTLLIAVVIVSGYPPGATWLWLLPIAAVNYLVIVGVGFLGALLVCYVRDFALLISLGMVFMLFTSGIFWDVRALGDPEMTQLVLAVNPVAFLLDAYRQVLMNQTAPDLLHLVLVAMSAIGLIYTTLVILRLASKSLALRALSA